jgi:hypothetical protein
MMCPDRLLGKQQFNIALILLERVKGIEPSSSARKA